MTTETYPNIDDLINATFEFERTMAEKSQDYDKYKIVFVSSSKFLQILKEHNKAYPKADKSKPVTIGGREVYPSSHLSKEGIMFAIPYMFRQ